MTDLRAAIERVRECATQVQEAEAEPIVGDDGFSDALLAVCSAAAEAEALRDKYNILVEERALLLRGSEPAEAEIALLREKLAEAERERDDTISAGLRLCSERDTARFRLEAAERALAELRKLVPTMLKALPWGAYKGALLEDSDIKAALAARAQGKKP